MTLNVLYVPHATDAAEETAAWAWLAAQSDVRAAYVAPDAAIPAVEDHTPDVVWVHATSPGVGRSDALRALRSLTAGGAASDAPGLLLTGGAAALPVALDLEPEPPNEVARREWRDEDDELYFFKTFSTFPHIRGHATLRGHPLFAGLGTATYTWWPKQDEAYTRVAYRHPAWPMNGRVIAVERSYIHINPDRATIWEYGWDDRRAGPDAGSPEAGAGRGTPDGARRPRVLCVGSYLYFASSDPIFRPLLERLAGNALRYAAGLTSDVAPAPAGGARRGERARDGGVATARSVTVQGTAAWRQRPARTLEETDPEPADSIDPPALAETLPPFDAPLRLAGPATDDRPFTLAGRRTLAAGGEARGIDEIWVHPLRVLKNLRIDGAGASEAVVTPVGIERRLRIDGHDVLERIFVSRDAPGAIVEWVAEPDGAGASGDGASAEAEAGSAATAETRPIRLRLSWRTDLRLTWPYPAGALGPLRWRRGERSVRVRTNEPGDSALFAFGRAPARWDVADASTADSPALEHRVALRLEPGESVRLAVVATTEGGDGLRGAVDALRRCDSPVHARTAALARLRRTRLSVAAPDPRVGEAVEWAKYRLDSYLVEGPGIGRSLVAGYWTSRDDWFHDGRPGYAWFFGRDAVWTALGSLAAGDRDAARDVIRFLGRHQDLSGKILHECSTSGVVHYDAADATPLYLLLVARYAAWTGDLGFLSEQWTHARAALEFCLSTDTDGDGLIENTRVGHGWIEFGRLGGGTVTFYNAGIWTAALRELADTAEGLGDQAFAHVLRRRAEHTADALEAAFHDADRGGYALNVRRDPEAGTWVRNPAQTAMQAVPLLLGSARPDRARAWYDAVADDDFTAPWGVRMLPRSDDGYDPKSYHGGAVWPLYTGWVGWAEYAAGRAESGHRHWRMVVDQGFERARGAWEEVLHGDERRAIGVCPDQAWSTAMAVAPLVYGMLGAEPDALKGRLRLRPQIPAEWDRLDVERLRVGDAEVSVRYRRDDGEHIFHLEQTSGAAPLTVIFEPALPGERVAAARVDEKDASLETRRFGERLLVPLQVVLDHERVIEIEMAGEQTPDGAPAIAGD